MGFASFLTSNHSRIAAVVFPVAISYGFIHQITYRQSPFESLRAWYTGAEEGSMQPLKYQLRFAGTERS